MNDPDSEEKFSVEQYYRDMDKIQKGGYVDLSRLGLPKHNFNVAGLTFILMIPVMFAWLVLVDPVYGWNRIRKTGMALTVMFTLVMFALLVFVGVQDEIGGQYGLAEDSPTFALMENMGAGGLAGVIFLLWPRTIILVVAVVGVIAGINYFIN
ncbi:MAG: hypothetical protein PVG12_06470 [Gammaproteobacteria bacterium]|jgi:hypothetical protein